MNLNPIPDTSPDTEAAELERSGVAAPPAPLPTAAPPRWLWQPNAIVFISSICTMVLELVASRIVAPYVGVSLYTWTSVIGVVLAGISLGNYLGGRLADRWVGPSTGSTGSPSASAGTPIGLRSGFRLLGVVFLLGGLTCLGVLAADALGPVIAGTGPVVLQIVVLTAALFFIPCAVLGCVSPIVAKLAVRDLARTGSTVGKIYAFSTAGSIVGTFAAGFWLISAFGTHTIVWGVAAVLLLMGLLFLFGRSIFGRVSGIAGSAALLALSLLALAGLTVAAARFGFLASRCTRETNYFCIKVQDEDRGGQTVRVLILDRLVHSYTSLADPARLIYDYEKVYAELAAYRAATLTGGVQEPPPLYSSTPPPLRALFIGGGGYTFPKYIEALYPGSVIRVVEIDPGVTQVAYSYLGLSPATSIVTHNEDARLFFAGNPDQPYDLVLGDAFNDFSVPYHLTTYEFNQRVRAWLAPGGLYLVNLIDGPRRDFLRAYVYTLRQTFPHVYVVPAIPAWRDSPRVTFVVVGTDQPLDETALRADAPDGRSLFAEQALGLADLDALLAEGRAVMLTDQYAPVDQMLAPVFRGEAAH